jgi:hypothetical protein
MLLDSEGRFCFKEFVNAILIMWLRLLAFKVFAIIKMSMMICIVMTMISFQAAFYEHISLLYLTLLGVELASINYECKDPYSYRDRDR